jgi:spermidine/putrescine transport system permease protein
MALPRPKRPKVKRQVHPLLSAYAVLAYFFLYAPILVIVVFSFNRSRLGATWTGFTLSWYNTLFDNQLVLSAAQNTLVVALVSTLVSTVIGTLLGVGLARYAFPGKRVFLWFMYVPVVIPEIIMAVSLILFYNLVSQGSGAWAAGLLAYAEGGGWLASPAAALGRLAAGVSQFFRLGLWTIILAHITFQIPFVAIVVRSRMAGFDANLEEAARDLGASEVQVLRHVTLPLIMPGVVAAGLLAFTLSVDDFVITFFTSGPGAITLPVYIFGAVKRGVRPDINALSTLIVAVTVALLLLSNRLARGRPAGRPYGNHP